MRDCGTSFGGAGSSSDGFPGRIVVGFGGIPRKIIHFDSICSWGGRGSVGDCKDVVLVQVLDKPEYEHKTWAF